MVEANHQKVLSYWEQIQNTIHVLDARYKALKKLPMGFMKGRTFPNCKQCEFLFKGKNCKCMDGCKFLLDLLKK